MNMIGSKSFAIKKEEYEAGDLYSIASTDGYKEYLNVKKDEINELIQLLIKAQELL